MKKYRRLFIIILSLLLVSSNIFWFLLYRRESGKLKNVVIPNLEDDYFQKQIILTRELGGVLGSFPQYSELYSDMTVTFKADVPLVLQNPGYPNGCEEASAVMLLKYSGIEIGIEEFINNYLPMNEVYEKDGKRFGPDPSVFYAGDPSDPKRGWGAFDRVIASAMRKVFSDKFIHNNELLTDPGEYEPDIQDSAIPGASVPAGKLPLNALTAYGPSVIWVTVDYEEVSDIYQWCSYDSRKTYSWPKNSHTVVLTGFDGEFYYINDPLRDKKDIPVEKTKLEKCFDSMGRQCVVLSEKCLDYSLLHYSGYAYPSISRS